jgi:hypothetical protein
MLRARVAAICAALLLTSVASQARAQATGAATVVPAPPQPQDGFTFRLRSVHGVTHESSGDVSNNDTWYGITPEIIGLYIRPRWQARASYAITGGLHSYLPDELAHAGSAGVSGELSRRLTGSLGGVASYSTVSNFLLANPANLTPLSAVPSSQTHLFTVGASQSLGWEASPVVRVDQRLDGTYVALDQAPNTVKNYFAGGALGVERAWVNDAVGAEARAGAAQSKGATIVIDGARVNADQRLVPVSLGPRWRHDWSRSLSHVATAGATVIYSPDKNTKPTVAPTGRAAVLYDWETAHVEASYSYGYEPNLLTAQLFRSHQATLIGTMPLSRAEHVAANATVGYLRGTYINLNRDAPSQPSFDAVRADLEVLWALRPSLQVLGRYQFLTQSADATPGVTTTALFRHAVLIGVQLTSAVPGVSGALSRSPQRVDRRDGGI